MVYAVFVLERGQAEESCQAFLKQPGKNMNHTVSDFVIRIKNAARARRKEIIAPYTRITKEIAKVLVKQGFLDEVKEQTVEKKKMLSLKIRYRNRIPALTDVKIISKPSIRVYTPSKNIIQAQRKGMFIFVLSTSKGILTGHEAEKKNLGGEVLFKVW